jgi:2-desacetyl-2-hydroxyethyl bacteriochlorophyllide A dehydrogenase
LEALLISSDPSPRLSYTTNHPEPCAVPGEVVVRVSLAGICATDLEIVRGYMGFLGVPGHEFVGVVETESSPLAGQRVVSEINCPCGTCDMCGRGWGGHCRRRTVLGIAGRDGAFAARLLIPEANCHVVPDEVPDEQAVFTELLAAAVQVIKLEPLERGSRVAVLGAGRLGRLVALVLAQTDCHVDVIVRSERAEAWCAKHGLSAVVVDGRRADPTYDVVVECTGVMKGLERAMQMCRPRGTIILKSTYADPPTIDLAPLVINELRVLGNRCGPFADALALLKAGKIPLDEMVAATFPLRDGVEAFKAAAAPGAMKVLLRPGAP